MLNHSLRSKIADFYRDRIIIVNELRLAILGLIVGILGGLSAVVFRGMIFIITYVFIDIPQQILPELYFNIVVIVVPTVGGLLVGILTVKVCAEARGHGIAEVIYAVNIKKGEIGSEVPLVKIIASSISIGSGGIAGWEGPIVQIGGGFGSIVADKSKLPPEQRKNLVISGVGAGLSAIFNAPLGGLLFALEIIARDKRTTPLITMVVASVTGTVVGILFLGPSPAFELAKPFAFKNPANIPIFILFGLIMGVFAFFWVKGFYIIEESFELLTDRFKLSPIFATTLGGFLVGVMLIFYPQIRSLNYENFNLAFSHLISLDDAVLLFIIVFIGTAITLGSGGSGGIFAPTLLLGAMLGTIFGYLFPVSLDIAFFALLGMAAMFGAAARAPLTAIIMTAEMTLDYLVIIPLMIAVIAAWFIGTTLLGPSDIFTAKLRKRNITFKTDTDILEDYLVQDIMIPEKDVITVCPKDRVEEVLDLLQETGHTGFPVVDENGNLVGIITEHDISNALRIKDLKGKAVSDIATHRVYSVIPTTPLPIALSIMEKKGINRLPVVDENSRKLVGWLTRSDIMRLYLKARHDKMASEYEDSIFENKFVKEMEF